MKVRNFLLSLMAGLLLMGAGFGCSAAGGGGGGNNLPDGDDPGTGGTDATTLRVSFNTGSGNFAVAQDEEGNEYSFRAREDENGDTVITEGNIITTEGETLKANLDNQGRPVNFRLSDNTNADVVYNEDGTASIRYTDADGTVSEGDEVNTSSARQVVLDRRFEAAQKRAVRLQDAASSDEEALVEGLETYEEICESIFDESGNPNTPLRGSRFREAALRIARIASITVVEEVEEEEIIEEIVIDETPELVKRLAGQTFVLFEAEGACVDLTGATNRLTFDSNGILQSEFDRYFVFPDFSFGGSADPGVTINYSTGTTVNLTPSSDVGFNLFLTPIFTGTQLDESGLLTIERRFQADIDFEVDSPFGATTATAQQLFDAAFVNGSLSDDDTLLEFDILLIDLQDENPVQILGRARYYNQNSTLPTDLQYPCEEVIGEEPQGRKLNCAGAANVSEEFSLSLELGRDELAEDFQFDWFVSSGYGFITSGEFSNTVTAIATAAGFVELSVIAHNINDGAGVFKLYKCQVPVGSVLDEPTVPIDASFLQVACPVYMTVGLPGFFTASGTAVDTASFHDWFVFGTPNFYILDPFATGTDITLHQPGRFDVAFRAYDEFGNESYQSCEVYVEGEFQDPCESNTTTSFYGDGICDSFCAKPDPDCGNTDTFADICKDLGYYGDGYCDTFCPYEDTDCSEEQFYDPCDAYGFYGDGYCDTCPYPDPDCEDPCESQGLYFDGVCDSFCVYPDPDCGQYDECYEFALYGDGKCDANCLYPDPDCGGYYDVCDELGFYDDGFCDYYCPRYDLDCDNDECAEFGYYGDGVCDECPQLDPDCDGQDVCDVYGLYGDGICDDYCALQDSDCLQPTDECSELGLYGDGTCDSQCASPDPDCDPNQAPEDGSNTNP